MKKLIFIIFFLFSSFFLLHSTAQVIFQKTLGYLGSDQGLSIQQTTDGGFIITGETNSFGAGSADVILIKTDFKGAVSWVKTYGGTSIDQGSSVQQTSEGGYIIAGHTFSFGAGVVSFISVQELPPSVVLNNFVSSFTK